MGLAESEQIQNYHVLTYCDCVLEIMHGLKYCNSFGECIVTDCIPISDIGKPSIKATIVPYDALCGKYREVFVWL